MGKFKELQDQKVYSIDILQGAGNIMKAYRATGSFKTGKFTSQKFSIEVAAENEAGVTEKIQSDLGSRHKLNRKMITIDEILLLKSEDITNPVVKHLAGVEQ